MFAWQNGARLTASTHWAWVRPIRRGRQGFINNSTSDHQQVITSNRALLDSQQVEVEMMLDAANAVAHGRTMFYLDNDTPKGRYGHLWWIDHRPDYSAWHDYDQPFDRWMCEHPEALNDDDQPMPYERRPCSDIYIAGDFAVIGLISNPVSCQSNFGSWMNTKSRCNKWN